MDTRLKRLAATVVDYSCRIKAGDNVLINAGGFDCLPFIKLIIKEVYKKGAFPFVEIRDLSVTRELMIGATLPMVELLASFDAAKMDKMQAFISVGSNPNSAELSDVSDETQKMYDIHYTRPVHYNIRVAKTNWVVMRYPTNGMAQQANMSLERFTDFYFDVCGLDYKKMSLAMDGLCELMDKTDKVRITGAGTDLRFSIKDIPSVKCDGKFNLPDGEVYTAPVKDSVNGVITYNVPSEYNGTTYENVKLTFENGKIVKSDGNLPEKLEKIFNTDEGARYVGEFALGVNPYILEPMKNTLFDEKIMGSFHFTPGQCYKNASNGNESSIHWDLVAIQTKQRGGGEIYFDDALIRKDGVFVHEKLLALNPENLK